MATKYPLADFITQDINKTLEARREKVKDNKEKDFLDLLSEKLGIEIGRNPLNVPIFIYRYGGQVFTLNFECVLDSTGTCARICMDGVPSVYVPEYTEMLKGTIINRFTKMVGETWYL